MPLAAPMDKGAIASACHCCCCSTGTSKERGSEAQATPLHSKAKRPALFQRERGTAGAIERPNEGLRMGGLNTGPLIADRS